MLGRAFLDNPLNRYFLALAAFLALFWGFGLARKLVVSRLRALALRTQTDLDDLLVDLLEMVRTPECVLVVLWAATRYLRLPGRLDGLLHALLLVVLTYRAVTMLRVAADYLVRKLLISKGRFSQAEQGMARTISYLISGLLWVTGALFVLSNLGFNVTSMLAGLGIGGVAVALAAQAVLGDLFSALAIYLDQPFVVGDFIVVGDMMGTVEHIGIKTTRVRALSGEMLIVANSRLTSAQIQNFRQLQERRIVIGFSVPYRTPAEQVKNIPQLVRAAVAAAPKARFDRAHLKSFEEAGFAFEAVYFVTDPDYGIYMDTNQAIHLALLDAFRREGISFALPSRVVFQQSGDGA